MNPILWSPSADAVRSSRWYQFQQFVQIQDVDALHRWSLEHRGAFWSAVWNFCHVLGEPGATGDAAYVPGPHMTDAKWFPGARLNFAENLLRPGEAEDTLAIHSLTELGRESTLTRRELLAQATAFANFLREHGVLAGDRVAAVVPNTPEAIIAFLGTVAIGAIWSSCSPDFGEDAIRDRFRQIEPTAIVTTETASYNGKVANLLARVESVLTQLPSVRVRIVAGDAPAGWTSFAEAIAKPPASFEFQRFPFDHPLAILYSSGTTGVPKCIVHGAGGTLLQHLKEHQLHCDVRESDRLFFFTTTGWMMWNWLVTGLASKAAIVLFDGSPFHPTPEALWQLAGRVGITQFGAGAKYYAHLEKVGIKPRESHDLAALRCVLSTGSPLLPESFEFIYRDVKADVDLASISGGTDIVSCFVLGCPIRPVRRGEIQTKGLGLDVQILDSDGRRIFNEPGELICASPFPSMPVSFWNDPGKAKYLASYFEVFPNIWCHGDWAEETSEGGFIIYGRSDTTLKPGGVRIGTAEIYQQVETFSGILESLATALRQGGDERIVLFVRMKPGHTLDASLIAEVKHKLRSRCSPRHVPAFLLAAPEFPRTISGKLSEVAVRNLINGLPLKNTAALANPESLEFFRNLVWN